MFKEGDFYKFPQNKTEEPKPSIEQAETEDNLEATKIINETKNEQPEFMTENFKSAINDRSLLGYAMASDKEAWIAEHELSEFEASLIAEGKKPKINLMIDIDGVLIDTESELKKLAEIMTSDFKVIKNAKEATSFIKQSKIPYDVLKTLLQARDQAEEVHLVTDRMGYGPYYFPCLGKAKRQVLEDHGLNLKTNAFKMFKSGEEFVPMISQSDITYYIGSSNSDRMYVDRIREAMTKSGEEMSENKLKYLEIMPHESRDKNIL